VKRKQVIAYGGFSDGKLDYWATDHPAQLAIWKTRREARRRYEDVRKVKIIEVVEKK